MPAASFRWDLEEELWLKQRVLEEYPEQSEATRPDWYRQVITDFKDRFQHVPTPTDGDFDRLMEGDEGDKWDKAPERMFKIDHFWICTCAAYEPPSNDSSAY
ncbi:hypothetical protein HETIRDRAFT_412125 [Heterobasidion irregulare TC 32-1]|uniref:Uncharacterized protein n=1 Tax=Heterobasidion irregulare (strain TC 32-1) TaxID=747525 RepID=W4JQH0_HETIT|nr:uncharacterized protein HETIRDRAFT_412125 [Heterobasidion irregulare TC 32-1]ETW75734.1 hypothetical protein HETIRDRAFT_412125 [Heterobasidion irregulare TC 32-1]